MTGRLVVDTGRLREISAELEMLQKALQDTVFPSPGELGCAELSDCLHHAVTGWRVRRRGVCADLASLAALASRAAEELEGTDVALARCLPRGAR